MSKSQATFLKSCDVCYRRKVKCDRRMPRCQHCVARNEQCTHTKVFRVFTPTKKALSNQHEQPSKVIKPTKKTKGWMVISIAKKEEPIPLVRHLDVLKFLLNNSFIDLRKSVHLSKEGHMDYIGSSPMGLLVTMYVMHHSSRLSQDPLALARIAFPCNSQPTDLFRGFDLQSLTDHARVATECLSAYFTHFHPFCPLVDEISFLSDLGAQPPMLVNIMCAIGQTYLSHVPLHYSEYYTSKAILEVDLRFLSNGSLSKVAALLLLGHFQHSPSQFGKSWYFLGLAFRMALSLGLDRPPPSGCPPPVERVRFYLWSWCHILDKGFSFGLNRPWFIAYQCYMDKAALQALFFNAKSDPDASKKRCIFLYTYQFSVVSHLLSIILCRFKFTEHLQKETLERQKGFASFISRKLHDWRRDMLSDFDAVLADFPFPEQVNKFRSNLDLIYQGTLVQLLQSFTASSKVSIRKVYYEETITAAIRAVRAANSLGSSFSFSGNTYRFYCLSTATLFLLRATRETDHQQHAVAMEHFCLGMGILKRSQSTFLMALECHRIIDALARAEGAVPSDPLPARSRLAPLYTPTIS